MKFYFLFLTLLFSFSAYSQTIPINQCYNTIERLSPAAILAMARGQQLGICTLRWALLKNSSYSKVSIQIKDSEVWSDSSFTRDSESEAYEEFYARGSSLTAARILKDLVKSGVCY